MQELQSIDLNLFLLVLMRMSGCILFSPIFGRRNVPALLKAGLCFMLSLAVYPLATPLAAPITDIWLMAVVSLKEIMIGFAIGLVLNLFLSAIMMGGEIIDMQTGISMAKIYDPASNVSMPMSASFINVFYMLIFFMSNGHLTLIRIFAQSGQILPYGTAVLNPQGYALVGKLFSLALTYAAQLCMPIVAVGLVTEVGVGLLMKAVPQVDVFTVNLQLKLIVGFGMLLLLVQPLALFLDRLIALTYDNIAKVLQAFGAS